MQPSRASPLVLRNLNTPPPGWAGDEQAAEERQSPEEAREAARALLREVTQTLMQMGHADGELAKMLFAIPAVKGVEFGDGFSASGSRDTQSQPAAALTREMTLSAEKRENLVVKCCSQATAAATTSATPIESATFMWSKPLTWR